MFCGDDSTQSRNSFTTFIRNKEKNGYRTQPVLPQDLPNLLGKIGEQSLFAEKILYVTEGLETVPFRKSAKIKKDSFFESIAFISRSKNLEVVTWEEEKQARLCKLKDVVQVHESKLSQTIFNFLENIRPGNKSAFIVSLRKLVESQDEMFIFIMLQRHIVSLIQAHKNKIPSTISPWQKAKIVAQSKTWEDKKLSEFYNHLNKIEVGMKTNNNPYGIRRSLEILACHYLS